MAKVSNFFTVAFLSLIVNCAVAASGGHEGSGGGDTQRSSSEQVIKALHDTPRIAGNLIQSIYRFGILNPENIHDQELQGTVEEMFGLPSWRIQDDIKSDDIAKLKNKMILFNNNVESILRTATISGTSLKISMTDPCFSNDKAKEASTEYYKGAPICFSAAYLERLTPDALKSQLLGLFFHELAHQYGYNEKTAQGLQLKILKAYSVEDLASSVYYLLGFQNFYTDGYICSKLGKITVLAQQAQLGASIRSDLLIQIDKKIRQENDSTLLSLLADANSNLMVGDIAAKIMENNCEKNSLDRRKLNLSLTVLDYVLKSL